MAGCSGDTSSVPVCPAIAQTPREEAKAKAATIEGRICILSHQYIAGTTDVRARVGDVRTAPLELSAPIDNATI